MSGAADVEIVDEPDDGGPVEAPVPGERQRLYLHIGLPKSGSTFLQSVLGGNRSALKECGYLYPYVRREGMFHAALEVSGHPEQWGIDPADISGTFAHLLRRGRRLGGRVVLSHEIFGAATTQQVEAIAEQVADFDVHVVVTVRDIGKMLTAQWQERVKNGHRHSFAEYADEILAGLPSEPDDAMVGFWRGQNLAWVLDRFRPLAPPERTHIVITPASGAGPEVLWGRFAAALELPEEALDLSDVPPNNESLGTPQIAFLRRVLDALDDRLEQPWFSVVAKRWFAQSILSTVRSPKPVTPAPVADRLAAVARAWIDLVTTRGYQVHGELAELIPDPVPAGTPHPDDVTPADMLDGLPDVVAAMLLRARDDRIAIQDLRADNVALTQQVAELTEAALRRPWWRRVPVVRRAGLE